MSIQQTLEFQFEIELMDIISMKGTETSTM